MSSFRFVIFHTLLGFFTRLYGCSSCSLITGLLIDDVYTAWFFFDWTTLTVTDTVYENSLLGFATVLATTN